MGFIIKNKWMTSILISRMILQGGCSLSSISTQCHTVNASLISSSTFRPCMSASSSPHYSITQPIPRLYNFRYEMVHQGKEKNITQLYGTCPFRHDYTRQLFQENLSESTNLCHGKCQDTSKTYHMHLSVTKVKILLTCSTTFSSSTFSTIVAYSLAKSFQWSPAPVLGVQIRHTHVPDSYKWSTLMIWLFDTTPMSTRRSYSINKFWQSSCLWLCNQREESQLTWSPVQAKHMLPWSIVQSVSRAASFKADIKYQLQCRPIALWNVGPFNHINNEHITTVIILFSQMWAIVRGRGISGWTLPEFVASIQTVFSEIWYGIIYTSTKPDIYITLTNNCREICATIFKHAYQYFLSNRQSFMSTLTSSSAHSKRSKQQTTSHMA